MLGDWGCADVADVASLLVSELVTNVVLHAHSDAELYVRVADGLLRVEVRDDNPRPPARKHYGTDAATGRGMLIVEELSTDWGVEERAHGGGGKAVWFELWASTEEGGARQAEQHAGGCASAPGEGGGVRPSGGGTAPARDPRTSASRSRRVSLPTSAWSQRGRGHG